MIIIKSQKEIEKMRVGNSIVAGTLNLLKGYIQEGITTLELDRIAESNILKKRGKPAFKGYRGFPNTLCVSVNDQVVHGIPSKRRLKKTDLISMDLGVLYDGYYGDAAVTVPVGIVVGDAVTLMDTAKNALRSGIDNARKGNYLSDISSAIQSTVEGKGFSVVRSFVGHGIGMSLHEEPQVPNFGKPGKGPILKKGMVIAVEPMVNAGRHEVNVLEDNWTVVTSDGSLSVHYEHTIAITDSDADVLTNKLEF